MFELGYAIGADRRIWLLRDPSDAEAKRTWDAIRTLTTIGFAKYSSSDQIRAQYLRDQPHLYGTTIYRTAVMPSLLPVASPRLFHLPSPYDTDANRAISERINDEGGAHCQL
jgi:hypothetical protein